jgi:hypothetical protein
MQSSRLSKRRAALWLVSPVIVIALLSISARPPRVEALGSVNVLTRSYDNGRAGTISSETSLSTSTVNTSGFGKLFQLMVDDQVYGQILYASGVSIAGGTHNVIYVTTVNNSVYAFDADVAGAPLWQRNYNGTGRPGRATDVGTNCGTYKDFSGNIGIVGSPVIDGAAGTIYFVARTVEGGSTVQRLRAVDITTGNERSGSPVVIQASVPGTGDGAAGGTVAFNPLTHNQRTALGLASGAVYIGWAGFCDTRPYHGWVMAYDAATLARVGVFNATPNGDSGGVWMSGAGPAIDGAGNLYYATGNGSADAASGSFGQSLVKLAPRTLARLDFFTASDFSTLNAGDHDLGVAGPSFVPGSSLIVQGSKLNGKAYLLDSNNLGHLVNGDTQIPQFFNAADPTARPAEKHHIHNTMVLWPSPAGLNLYVWAENDFLRAYRFNTGTQRFDTPSVAAGSILPPLGMPGNNMVLSANGSTAGSGVLWSTQRRAGDASNDVVPGVLYAFNAETLGLLWSSSGAGDDPLNYAKGGPPVVANGKVYVPTFSNAVMVYGRRTTPPPSQNLALGKPATGSAPCNTDETPAKAVNGSVSGGNSDKFCSKTTPRFLQVDLGASVPIAQIIVEHAGAGGESFTFNSRDFDLQVSNDGTSFATVATVTGNTYSITTHNITTTSARFVRLNVTNPTQTTNTSARIYELQVLGPLAGGAPTVLRETESLAVAATSGDVHRVAADAGYSGGQGTILEANAAGDFVSYTVNVPEARIYDVRVGIKKLGNRGIWQLAIDGANQGPTVDGFSSAAAFVEVDLGNKTFAAAGNKTFRFQVTGKNAASTSFWIALDYIKLVPR